ncbi:Tyrosyl-DNA phosphodiesterase [Popillia japonica]|uniref:Tyrosyl-DNA phosphodiesterase n=1 Tax=Popillia japonica TaxID=7064 RepID=A0AAW1IVM8_POPJA
MEGSMLEESTAKKLKLSNEEAEESDDDLEKHSLGTSSKENIEQTDKQYSELTLEEKLKDPNSYNLFHNKINYKKEDSEVKADDAYSITFKDLLSLGNESLHITYNFTENWFKSQFSESKNSQADVWYEKTWTDYGLGETEANFGKTITLKPFQLKTDSQTDRYHSKISLFYYKDDKDELNDYLRVVVMTANLTPNDWDTHSQGIWISPKCYTTSSVGNGDNKKTKFKVTLLAYLRHYRNEDRNPEINESFETWVSRVENANFEERSPDCFCAGEV